ncbi:MAG: M20/M25/M40 family metallo-hydrolase [Bacteroidota bacterium]
MKNSLRFFLIAGLMLAGTLPQYAQDSGRDKGLQAITKEVIQGQLEFLASDWTDGREAGTKGEYIASDYIASMFKLYGLLPGGDAEQQSFGRRGQRPTGGTPGQQPQRPEPKKTYFQNFNLVESSAGPVQEMSIITKSGSTVRSVNFDYQTDFSVNPGQVGMEIEVPIVFIGYGLSDEKKGYDDFKGMDIKGKFLIKLSGFPGSKDPTSKTYEKFKPEVPAQQPNDMERMFARMRQPGGMFSWAVERDAVGVIEYRPGTDPTSQWVANYPFRYNTTTYEGDVPQNRNRKSMSLMKDNMDANLINLTITDRVLNEILNGSGVDIGALEKQIAETGKPASRELTGKFIRVKTTVESRIVKVRNVIGVLEGKNTEEIIVIGGHYDHMGNQNGFIYNGADDNASGTVGVMTIAKAMVASGVKPEKTIVFAAWTAEEKGLIGSAYFVAHPYKGKVLCYLNYDMISRNSPGENEDKKISVNYSTNFPKSKELVEKYNTEMSYGMEVSFRETEPGRRGGGSDHSPFNEKSIPFYYFMAGMPAEYHQFTDHVDLVNWDKMLKIIQLGYLSIYDLAQMPWN